MKKYAFLFLLYHIGHTCAAQTTLHVGPAFDSITVIKPDSVFVGWQNGRPASMTAILPSKKRAGGESLALDSTSIYPEPIFIKKH